MKKTTRKSERQLRQAIIDKCRWMNVEGLTQGTSGNISARLGDTLLITPTAIPYEMLRPEMIAAMPIRRRLWQLGRAAQAVERMALPSRHHARPA